MMKMKKSITVLVVSVFIGICAIFILSTQKSFEEQLVDAMKADNEYIQNLVYAQMSGDQLLAFFRTKDQRMHYGLFRDNKFGFGKKLIKSGGSMGLDAPQGAITWSGLGAPDGEFNLLSGAVLRPDVAQIIVISEGNKAASIVEGAGAKIWFLTLDTMIQAPITIQASNAAGEVLYESGDVEYWTNNNIN